MILSCRDENEAERIIVGFEPLRTCDGFERSHCQSVPGSPCRCQVPWLQRRQTKREPSDLHHSAVPPATHLLASIICNRFLSSHSFQKQIFFAARLALHQPLTPNDFRVPPEQGFWRTLYQPFLIGLTLNSEAPCRPGTSRHPRACH